MRDQLRDLPTRHLDDGRPVQEALALERQHLRAMPAHLPDTCRVVARVADKFGHVRVDHITYSVVGAEVVAEHRRVFCRGGRYPRVCQSSRQ